MKRLIPLAGLLLLAPAVLLAQPGNATDKRRVDTNGDGVVEHAEAAAHPRLAAAFDRLDRNRDGRLGADERPMRGKHGRRGGHDGLARLDADRDGRISRAEFDQTASARDAGKSGKSSHRLDFAAADANRDGHLVRAEVRAYRERMRPQHEAERRARFDARFAAADLNRDGRLNRIEVDEAMPRLSQRFEWLDENRDGFLGRTEVQPRSGR
ncbi:hypothetical protein ACFFGH_05685 [Lysobacter korlensis]|uniref:EF-hand domain-containing protein n=1 Tax=Lysobacter korlensis TaxID=553636 RepID=A0ABV6RK49_9GAMM